VRPPGNTRALFAGGGKSLTFQLPAVLNQNVVVVVGPLLALARDQVTNWNDRGSSVPAVQYNSSISDVDKQRLRRDIATGDALLVYTTPESLIGDESLQEALQVR
jgi:ATP-dependent DNA helicase RecQ